MDVDQGELAHHLGQDGTRGQVGRADEDAGDGRRQQEPQAQGNMDGSQLSRVKRAR